MNKFNVNCLWQSMDYLLEDFICFFKKKKVILRSTNKKVTLAALLSLVLLSDNQISKYYHYKKPGIGFFDAIIFYL